MEKFFQNGRFGVRDQYRTIISADFDYISDFQQNDAFILAWKKPTMEVGLDGRRRPISGDSTLFSAKGEKIVLSYDEEPSVNVKIISVYRFDCSSYLITAHINNAQRQALINCNGDLIVPFHYNKIRGLDLLYNQRDSLKQNLLVVGVNVTSIYDPILERESIHGTWGVIDIQGNVIIPIIYDSVNSIGIPLFSLLNHTDEQYIGKYIRVKKGSKYGIFDRNGSEILPVEYTLIDVKYKSTFIKYYEGGEMCEERYRTFLRNGGWRILIEDSWQTSDMVFEAVSAISNQTSETSYIAAAVLNGVAGYVTHDLCFIPDHSLAVADIIRDSNVLRDETPQIEYDYGYSKEGLEWMYRGAYENDSEAEWNTD